MSPFEDSVQGAEKQNGYLGTLPHCWRLEWTLIGVGYANVVKDEEGRKTEACQNQGKVARRTTASPSSLLLTRPHCGMRGAGGGLNTCNVMYVPGFDCSQEREISGGLFEPSSV